MIVELTSSFEQTTREKLGDAMMFRAVMKSASISGLGLIGLMQPALAGPPGVPAPIVGAGLPLLLIAGGAYLAVKLVRTRRRDRA